MARRRDGEATVAETVKAMRALLEELGPLSWAEVALGVESSAVLALADAGEVVVFSRQGRTYVRLASQAVTNIPGT